MRVLLLSHKPQAGGSWMLPVALLLEEE